MSIQKTSNSEEFEYALQEALVSTRFTDHKDNYDTFFRGEPPKKQSKTKAILNEVTLSVLHRSNKNLSTLWQYFGENFSYLFSPKRYFTKTVENYAKFSYIYNKLADDGSRKLLVSLLAYRILGFRKIKLARNSPKYWDGIELAKTLKTDRSALNIPTVTWPLDCFDTTPIGFPMLVHTYAQAIAINFVQKQYVYDRAGTICKAEQGDIVIDAGACWGDTTLQFACEVGESGQVHAFEFVPTNLSVMRNNIALNPDLAERINILENPVGSNSGAKFYFYENGPASKITDTRNSEEDLECEVLSIDELVSKQQLPKVDFIKMDVEGAELDALKGAVNTIKKFRPKLAICIYHKPDDYIDIPKFIDDLDLGYQFHIDHHMIFLNETVLFARPV